MKLIDKEIKRKVLNKGEFLEKRINGIKDFINDFTSSVKKD